ncbi:MAG: redoxin family protein [Fimbriimonadaceae bacterium]
MKAFAFPALIAGTVAAFVVAGTRVNASSLEVRDLQFTPVAEASDSVVVQTSKAPDFSLKGVDGKTHTLESTLKGADEVVFYFIGNTCPINAKALPMVNKFANTANADKKVKFVGIIDTDMEGYKAWNKRFNAKYPVLLDEDKEVIAAFGAQRSPWFVVVNSKGEVVHTDKGYSKKSLQSMNERVAKLNGVEPVKVDLSKAPVDMQFG